MFSGKTEELIRRLTRARIARQRVEIFKPALDTRYHAQDVVSHNQTSIRSSPVQSPAEILLLAGGSTDVIGIDEAQFFDESLFFRNVHARDEPAMIRLLGERMIAGGIIDEDYVDGAIERERMSSTAFTDNLAVPHAMAMSARRTAIAIVVNDVPMAWGEQRVNVIAMIAFASAGRSSFQSVFDQFVEVFADRAEVQRLIRRSADFGGFIEELVRVIDS